MRSATTKNVQEQELTSRRRLVPREGTYSVRLRRGPPVPYWTGSPEIRNRSVGQFPYRAVYYLRGREVVLIAYAHEKRRPGYWRHRTSE